VIRFFADVTLVDEPMRVVTVDARDVLAWEAEHGASFMGHRATVTDLAWLAWSSLHRSGGFDGKYEEFADQVVDLQDRVFRLEEVDPTQPAPTTG
jgi:hypothetical protein